MDYKFYDTSSLLLRANDLFSKEEDTKFGFCISSITLQELENIKTSTYKSPEIKYAARHLLHLLDTFLLNDIELKVHPEKCNHQNQGNRYIYL